MTNFEKFKNELSEIAEIDNLNIGVSTNGKPYSCADLLCLSCIFKNGENGCCHGMNFLNWLMEEYVEKPKLTKQEAGMNKKLKPCPFCGGKAKLHQAYNGYYTVQCDNCGCWTMTLPSRSGVIEIWNTRKPIDRIIEQINKESVEDHGFLVIHAEEAIDIVKTGGYYE